MIKAAGCVLIIYASLMIGCSVGRLHVLMVRELTELLSLMKIIKGQMNYAGSELPEIMSVCRDRLHGSVGKWLDTLCQLLGFDGDKPFAQLWRESLVTLRELSVLPPEAILEVERLGEILGDMDVDTQMAQLAIVENELDRMCRESSGRTESVRKLSSSLGLLLGLFIVLLLV